MFERLKKTAKEKGYSLHELADKAGLGAYFLLMLQKILKKKKIKID